MEAFDWWTRYIQPRYDVPHEVGERVSRLGIENEHPVAPPLQVAGDREESVGFAVYFGLLRSRLGLVVVLARVHRLGVFRMRQRVSVIDVFVDVFHRRDD